MIISLAGFPLGSPRLIVRGSNDCRIVRRIVAGTLAFCFCVAAVSHAMAQAPPLPPIAAPGASKSTPPGQSASPGNVPPAPSRPSPDDSELAFSGLSDVTSRANADAPYMIGDFFVGNGQIILMSKIATNPGKQFVGQIPSAGGSQRAKISDDNSVLPEDRVFFLYNYFDNAILIPTPSPHALDVNRYTPGFEKTFWDRNASLELRIPFANTQNSDVFLAGNGKDQDIEFGDLEAALKFLIYRDDSIAFAAGVGFNMPTASDVKVFDSSLTQPLFTIKNGAFHVQPYVGLLYTPSDRLFIQTFVQFDIDATGNRVQQLDVGDVGTLHDQDLLQTDVQVGFWWWRDQSSQFITGVAPTIEYHYTTTMQDASRIVANARNGQYVFGNTDNRLDIQNLTVGLEMLIGKRSTLNIAGVVPLNRPNSANRQFDSEIFVEFNRFF